MIIDCCGLQRSFGDVVAVESVSFKMAEGDFLGILGPNGAGKSTTLNMLTTVLAPSAGEARVAGEDIRRAPERVRAQIGVVFQEPALDERLTARENLRMHAVLYRVPKREVAERVKKALDWAELRSAGDRLVHTFSGGMRRRLELTRALMHDPRLLFLDEPTLALDPQGRRDLWERIDVLRKRGVSVLMATHNLHEAEACDRVGVIDGGRMIEIGTPAELKLRATNCRDASLEDVFVHLTGRQLRDKDATARDKTMGFRRRGGELTR